MKLFLTDIFCSITVAIKKRSRVPGVMITQYVEQIPLGKSTPDFTRKPMATTVQEGKKALFKAMVNGDPEPTVTWERNKGEVNDEEMYKTRYDERAREHILEMPNVKPDQSDTYKCFATNEYGVAVCTVTLKVVEGKKDTQYYNDQGPQDFRSMLKKTKKQLPPPKEGEIDPKLWELLLSAPKKDYEKICFDFGVTDFRWMLKRLKQLKKEREDEQAKVVEKVENVKQIEVKPNGKAEFSVDMTLWDPNSEINLYKDGKLVPYGCDENSKPCLMKTGTKYVFSIKDPQPEDAGFYQLDVEEANILSTEFQVPAVEFIAKIKDAKAVESEDAIFQCVLSTPLNRITWSIEENSLDDGDKYEITVSEDKLIHTLRVKNCEMKDNGKYYAIAGITTSSASLTVEARDPMNKFKVGISENKTMNMQSPPSFIVPLKMRTAPQGYECCMSCAVKGDPAPRVTWYCNNMSLNTNPNYYISNICGVCSLLILRVGQKDNGEYKVVIENQLGTAECSMTLNVRGISMVQQSYFLS
uniref:Immunoglobulin like and fibronectin type III domain containing 1, tandem duplicate 2 n=1 Tax=Sphaeramia orbicularis TaxID=375764 RepID=A0A672ZHX7_9TELE